MRVAYEAELQAAQAAEKAREAAEGGEGDDHDRRTLPFKRRMVSCLFYAPLYFVRILLTILTRSP